MYIKCFRYIDIFYKLTYMNISGIVLSLKLFGQVLEIFNEKYPRYETYDLFMCRCCEQKKKKKKIKLVCKVFSVNCKELLSWQFKFSLMCNSLVTCIRKAMCNILN